MREAACAQHFRGACHKDMIAVDQFAFFIDAEAAVSIPVVCNADVRSLLKHRPLQGLQMCRSAAVIDVHSARECMDHLYIGAEAAQHLRHRLVGGTVRTVEHDLHAVEALCTGAHHIVDVLIEKIIAILHNPDVLARGTRRVVIRLEAADELFEFILHSVRQFVAVAAEELDAVVGKRIVRGRDHDACHRLVRAREIGDRRRRNHARQQSSAARRADARRQRRLEHLARDACIAPDQNTRAHIRTRSEIERRRTSKMVCQLRCEFRIGLSAHSVRSKKSHCESPLLICFILIIIYFIFPKKASAAFSPSSAALIMPPA